MPICLAKRTDRYRVADNVNLPLRIIPAVQEEGRSRVTINLKVSADFSYKLFGSNIVVKVGFGFWLLLQGPARGLFSSTSSCCCCCYITRDRIK